MSSIKREQPQAKKPKVEDSVESNSSQFESKQKVVLNPADCDLDFNIDGNGLQGSALYEQGFAYCWSGARANVGINGGKYYFSCKVISAQPVDMEDTPPVQQHVCRIGISRGDDTVGELGEMEHSFGFGGTGKFSTARKFLDYGEKFGVGDTIICAVSLEDKPLASVGFFKNGRWLGVAKHFDAGPKGLGVVDSPIRKLQWESALFPHILLKNVVVEVQFNIEEGLAPIDGYEPWVCSLKNGHAIMGPTFPNSRDCELMMMVGLPASGKTTWAEKWVKEHPEKRYILLGTNLVLDQMKVPGLLRKNNYGERFDRLMDRATGIFNVLLSRAANTYRNYIIDQTNVYKSARRRKLKPFASFRKVAVVTFPTREELKFRADKRFREMGKEVPTDALNEMIANYVLPMSKDMDGSDEFFDEVIFTELSREESQKHLDEMKSALRVLERTPSQFSHSSSPYSRESSFQTYAGHPLLHQGPLEVNGNQGQISRDTLPVPHYSYACHPNQVNYTYRGPRPYGNSGAFPDSYQVNPMSMPPRGAAPYHACQLPAVPRADVSYEVGWNSFAPRAANSYEAAPYQSSQLPVVSRADGPFEVGRNSFAPRATSSYEAYPRYNSYQPPRYEPAYPGGPYNKPIPEGSPFGPAFQPYGGTINPSSTGGASIPPYGRNVPGARSSGNWRFPS